MIRALFNLVLLASIGGGGAAYFLSQAQPQMASGVAPVVVSADASATFDAKVVAIQAAFDTAQTSGTAQPVSVLFTEAELTSRAAVAIESLTGGIVPTDPQIHLRPGSILLTAGVSISGFPVKLAVVAIPVVAGGQAGFAIEELETGLPLPDGIKTEISDQIAKILSPQSLGIPVELTKIEVQQGRLLLEGIAQP